MMTKPLLLLTAVILASLIASPGMGCRCKGTISTPIKPRVIVKIEILPISGHCRRTEIIVARRNGSKICLNPAATATNELLQNLQKRNGTISTTTVPY
ncbi:C-X-C motif chemokine 13 precursor [Larimichthys crocea]|uniref:CXCL13 chemokine n=1 Tax=Larimichthys crocea TaxID=215358 RepID=D4N2Q0_LARCR|nr:C-X-C motif chemokine 13 precursor [Larimichthys crocea]ADD63792.1 CXCL13 chemokine [Larimichthys crocea]